MFKKLFRDYDYEIYTVNPCKYVVETTKNHVAKFNLRPTIKI